MVFAFVEANRGKYSTKLMCAVLEVSEGGYYQWRKRPKSSRAIRDEDLGRKISIFHCGSRSTYGAPRIHKDLKVSGEKVGRKRVARLMKQHGLRGKCKRRFKITSKGNPKRVAVQNHLEQNFSATQPNQKWASDITYVPTREGWLYLAVVLDLFSRKVVGWAMSSRMTDDLTLNALRMALQRRLTQSKTDYPGLIFHSDKGSQYASAAFRLELDKYRITQSMSGEGNCFDNAVSESFFATLKTEEVKPRGRSGYNTRQQAMTTLFDYIETFYNRTRRHSTLGYLSPLDFENLNQHNARQVA